MENAYAVMTDFVNPTIKDKASIFAYHVPDPERFSVVEFGENHEVLSLEEKPAKPKSHFASVGLYFYPNDVVEKTLALTPSKRGELDITDLNNVYLNESRLQVIPMRRGSAWMDAGTPDSLMDASEYIQIIEKRQGLKLGCIEEIAYNRGFINRDDLQAICDGMNQCAYKDYLLALVCV